MIGGLPFSGLGMNTSIWQTSTHVLHPSQISGLKTTGALGVATLGMAITFSLDIFFLQKSIQVSFTNLLFLLVHTGIVFIMGFVFFFHVAPKGQWQFADLYLVVFQFNGKELVPLRRVDGRVIYPL